MAPFSSSSDLERLRHLAEATRAPRWFTRSVTLGRLEVVSLAHSCIYVALLIAAFGADNPQPITTILGFAHGTLWIAMSLICLLAARYRVLPWWLAVCVVVLGGIGPFFGSAGFILESRRRAARAGGPGAASVRSERRGGGRRRGRGGGRRRLDGR